jgi:uncharacterized protein (TIGR03435 family)
VWWIGARLVDERERACDAETVRLGSDPQVYAESILKVCQLYVESPLACVAGVTGSNLKKRIERIMSHDMGITLNTWRKTLLATAATAVLVAPIAVGSLKAARLRAQSFADAIGPPFATVSVLANTSGDSRSYPAAMKDGRFAVKNVTLRWLIGVAYDVFGAWRIEGGPSWIDADRFDVEATAPGQPKSDQMRSMIRRLLADQFKVAVHAETREGPVYALVVTKNDGTLGPQIRASACTGKDTERLPPGPVDPYLLHCGSHRSRPGSIAARYLTMTELAQALSLIMGRMVVDRTGVAGRFDLEAAWTPAPGPPGPAALGVGPTTFRAIEDQLGLSLASETGPIQYLVIDRAEKPSAP